MADGGTEPKTSTGEDRDVVDLTWLTGLFDRLSRRLFGEPPTPPAAAELAYQAPNAPPPEGTDPGSPVIEAERPDNALAAAAVIHDGATTEVPPAPARTAGLRGAVEGFRETEAYRLARSRYVLPVAFVVVIGIVSLHNHFDGVDWGDDFALYIHQAKGLATGNIAEVLRDNRFAVDNSGWHSFSPYAYPWGWPLILAPFYAAFGLNYGVFKFLEVLAFCVFLVAFFAIVRRRTSQLSAFLLTAAIGVSRSFNGATDSVLSDLPYLCFVGLTLWWIDCCRERGMLELSRRHSVVLGALIAFTYSIRREGVSLLVAVMALQLVVLAGVALRQKSIRALREVDGKTVSLPYLTFAGFVVVFQLLLPTVFLPNAPGAGLSNIPARVTWYKDVLAEHVGLKKAGFPPAIFNSERAARTALLILVLLAATGIAARLLLRLEQDAHLAAYLSFTTLLMLISPYQDGRYFFTITPLVLYFAYQALPAMAELIRPSRAWARGAVVLSGIGLTGFIVLNTGQLKQAYDYHSTYRYTLNGPESPPAKEMFQTLDKLTRADDVILFFRARAMNLYSGRRAVQGSNLELMLPRSDWYVMAKGSTYSQTLLTDEEAAGLNLTKAWENGEWVIWRVPRRP